MRWSYAVPVILFAGLAIALGVGLTLKPSEIPSALIGRQIPDFALVPLDADAQGLSSRDLRQGELTVVNVFASWCLPCRVEHPQLMALADRHGITVHAINYKDDPDDARRFLTRLGNPFTLIGADRQGRAAIDWGVYGVPETFIVDGSGRILHKHLGPIMDRDLEHTILPLIEEHAG